MNRFHIKITIWHSEQATIEDALRAARLTHSQCISKSMPCQSSFWWYLMWWCSIEGFLIYYMVNIGLKCDKFYCNIRKIKIRPFSLYPSALLSRILYISVFYFLFFTLVMLYFCVLILFNSIVLKCLSRFYSVNLFVFFFFFTKCLRNKCLLLVYYY